MAEWSIAPVLKTGVLRGTGGSNPSLSAREENKNIKTLTSNELRFFVFWGNGLKLAILCLKSATDTFCRVRLEICPQINFSPTFIGKKQLNKGFICHVIYKCAIDFKKCASGNIISLKKTLFAVPKNRIGIEFERLTITNVL